MQRQQRPLRWSMMQPGNLAARRLLSSIAPLPLPSQREVHLWYAMPNEIQDPRLLDMYRNILSPCERDSILCMNDNKIQKGALLSRALVRTTLSRYTNCKVSPGALRFRRNRFGKPELEWQGDKNWELSSLHFNISHSNSMVACGVTVDLRIGIDVEEKLRVLKNDILSFARRYFTPKEVNYLGSFSDGEIQRQEFIKMWTIKEAYVKALGRGFSASPFREFSIRYLESCKDATKNHKHFTSALPQIVVEPCEAFEYLTTNWRFALLELARSQFASICVEKDGASEVGEGQPLALRVWKAVPFVSDKLVSGTEEVMAISGELELFLGNQTTKFVDCFLR